MILILSTNIQWQQGKN